MRTSRKYGIVAMSLFLVASIAACGGGGSSGLITIEPLNAEQVASTALGAGDFIAGLSYLADDLVDVIEGGVSGTFPCPGGGTASVTLNDVAPTTEISAGDRVTFSFNNCVMDFWGEPVTFQGSLTINVTSSNFPGPDAYDIVTQVSFSNLMLDDGVTTYTVSGGFTLHVNTPDGITYSTMTTGSSLTAKLQEPGWSVTAKVANFTYEELYDDNTGDYSFDAAGSFYSSELGGWFDGMTTVTMSGTAPDEVDTGEYLVTGKDNTSVLTVALNSVDVQLRVDGDGDGTPETTINTTWSSLQD